MTNTDVIPTHDELRAFIKKIAEFLKKFVEIFDKIIAGLKLNYGTYERIYGEDTAAEEPAVEGE